MDPGQTWRFVAVLSVLAFTGWDAAAGDPYTALPLCEGPADILFVLDASASISRFTEYPAELQFVSDVTKAFDVGLNKVRFSSIVYSDTVNTEFSFTDHLTNNAVETAILGLPYVGRLTFTGMALKQARLFGITNQNGARINVPKIVIVVTDGGSLNKAATQDEANLLKATGATVIAVGIGNGVSQAELNDIASDPSLVFNVVLFNDLSTVRDQVASAACPSVTPSCINNCFGREDGNYAACSPLCENGYYFSCVNEFTYQMPCALAYYTDHNGNQFTARMVYNPATDTCELSVESCPRNPEDYKVDAPAPTPTPVDLWNPTCIGAQGSCADRADGNYPICFPECQEGFFITCSNGEVYEMPCALGWYTVNNVRFTHRMLYNPSTDSCELTVPYCPRTLDPNDHTTEAPHYYSTPAPCTGKADILIIKDSSSSIGLNNYATILAFLADFSSYFPISSDQFHFSAIVFSTSVNIVFKFNDNLSSGTVFQAITNCPYFGGSTNTAAALDLARTSGFSSGNGARSNVPKIAIVITDGFSSDPAATAVAADALRRDGVIVISIGVGGARPSELQAIASKSSNVFTVSRLSLLDQIRNAVVQITCESLQVVTSCVTDSSSCSGRPAGTYATCDAARHKAGWYWTCTGGQGYETRCGVIWCYNAEPTRHSGYGVFNTNSKTCERDITTCPP